MKSEQVPVVHHGLRFGVESGRERFLKRGQSLFLVSFLGMRTSDIVPGAAAKLGRLGGPEMGSDGVVPSAGGVQCVAQIEPGAAQVRIGARHAL